jgi:hypothetical protein
VIDNSKQYTPKVLCWRDANGGLHIDSEHDTYFLPIFKVSGAVAAICRIQLKLEDAKSVAQIFLDSNKPTTG